MRKALKVLGIGIGSIVVLIVVAVVIAVLVIDPNDYRGDIQQAFKQQTGRTLAINGKIELSVFPWLGLSVGQTTLGNAPGFNKRPFAKIDNLQLHVRLLSLLEGHPEVGEVELKGLTVNLARAASGKTNWQDLLGEPAQTPPTTAQTTTPAESGGTPSVVSRITVDSIKLINAQINWRDRANQQQVQVQDANIIIGKLRVGQAFPLHVDFVFQNNKPALQAKFALDTTVTLDPAQQKYRLADGQISVDAHGAGLPVSPAKARVGWQAINLNLSSGAFAVKKLVANALGAQVKASLTGGGLNDTPHASGTLSVDDFSARQLLSKLGVVLDLRDSDTLKHVALSTQFKATTHNASLSNFKLHLDDTHLKGQVAITDFDNQALRFNLALDQINIDRYLPKSPADESATADASVDNASLDEVALPGDVLRGLNIDGHLTIGALTAFNLKAHDIKLGVSAHNGTVKVSPLAAELYDGQYQGTITATAAGKGMAVKVIQHLSGVQFAPLMKDLYGKAVVSGHANIDIKAHGAGESVGALLKTLDGNMQFNIKDGALEGVDVWRSINRAYAKIKGQTVPPKQAHPATKIVGMSGSGQIVNGVLHNDDFKAALPYMRMAGHGTVDLVKQAIDYHVDTHIVKSHHVESQDNLGVLLDGYAIPVIIRGAFDDLTIRPDVRAVLKRKAAEKLADAKAKAQAKLDQKKAKLKRQAEAKKAAEKKRLEQKKAAAKAKLEKKKQAKKAKLKEQASQKLKHLFD